MLERLSQRWGSLLLIFPIIAKYDETFETLDRIKINKPSRRHYDGL